MLRWLPHCAVSRWQQAGEAGRRRQMRNQDVINAFFSAARSLGMEGSALMGRAGLVLAKMVDPPPGTRDLPYTGPPIETLPGLSDEERAALRAALLGGAVAPSASFVSWEHRAEPGLHGPADPGGGWTDEAFDVVRRAKVRAV